MSDQYNTNPGVRGSYNSTSDPLAVTSLSLGLEARGGRMLKIIPRGTRYPCIFEENLQTSRDHVFSVHFGIYEGERAKVENNRKIAGLLLELDNTNNRRGYPLKVVFKIGINGILTVTLVEVKTGKTAKIKINYDGKPQDDPDIRRIVQEAKEHEREDAEFIELFNKREAFKKEAYTKLIEKKSKNQTTLVIVQIYPDWSDKPPNDIREYDKKLTDLDRKIARYL